MNKTKVAQLFNVSEEFIDRMIADRKLPIDLNVDAVYEVLAEFKQQQNEALAELADITEEIGLDYE